MIIQAPMAVLVSYLTVVNSHRHGSHVSAVGKKMMRNAFRYFVTPVALHTHNYTIISLVINFYISMIRYAVIIPVDNSLIPMY